MRSTSSIVAVVVFLAACASPEPDPVGIDDTDTVAPSVPQGTVPVVSDRTTRVPEDQATPIVLSAAAPSTQEVTFRVVTSPTHGTLTGEPPSLTYTPDADYNGPDALTFEAASGDLVSDVATITLDVTPRNDAPVLASAVLTTPEDTALVVDVPAVDVDGDTVRLRLASAPAHGTVTDSGGVLTYVPVANYAGDDHFTVTGWDGVAASAAVDVSVTVTPVDDPPTATALRVTTDEDVAVDVHLVGNDVDGDALTWTVEPPAHGILIGQAPDLTYVPQPDYAGSDSFVATVRDATSAAAPVTISLTVRAMPDAPVTGGPVVATAWAGEPTSFALPASDVDGDDLTWLLTVNPSIGVLTGRGPTFTFTPSTNTRGTVVLTWSVRDSTGRSSPSDTVTFDVSGPSRPPDAISDVFDAVGNALLAIGADQSLLLNDTDPDGETLSVVPAAITTQLGGLLAVRADGTFDYLPPVGRSGIVDRFSYTVRDSAGNEDVADVLLRVGEVVWFVDGSADAGGDGRSTAPLRTLAEAQAVAGDGDLFSLAESAQGYLGPITLQEGQQLWGAGVPLVVGGVLVRPASNAPVVAAAGGPVVIAADHAEIHGLILDTPLDVAVQVDGVDDVLIDTVTVLGGSTDAVRVHDAVGVTVRDLQCVSGAGAAVRGTNVRGLVVEGLGSVECAQGVVLDGVAGTVTVRDSVIDGAATAVSVQRVTGALTLTVADTELVGSGISAALDGPNDVAVDLTFEDVTIRDAAQTSLDLPLRHLGSAGRAVGVHVDGVTIDGGHGDGFGLRLREGARATLLVTDLDVTGASGATSASGVVVEALDTSAATAELVGVVASDVATGVRLQAESGGDVIARLSSADLDAALRDVDVVRGSLGSLDVLVDSGTFRGPGGLSFEGGSPDGRRLVASLVANAAAGPYALRSVADGAPMGSLALVGVLDAGLTFVGTDHGNVAADANTNLSGGAPTVQVTGRVDLVDAVELRTP
ncbi:MAG: tandem-95 repeat protein [Alphaproteobacteria bacterium]|nr:tandem-95 repeat protein [Alphaproteobacteria bacterium]